MCEHAPTPYHWACQSGRASAVRHHLAATLLRVVCRPAGGVHQLTSDVVPVRARMPDAAAKHAASMHVLVDIRLGCPRSMHQPAAGRPLRVCMSWTGNVPHGSLCWRQPAPLLRPVTALSRSHSDPPVRVSGGRLPENRVERMRCSLCRKSLVDRLGRRPARLALWQCLWGGFNNTCARSPSQTLTFQGDDDEPWSVFKLRWRRRMRPTPPRLRPQ